MTSKLYRLDDQKRKSERMLIDMVFGTIVGGLIGVIPFVLSNGYAWGAWICCVELGFSVGVSSYSRFQIKGYVYFLIGIIIFLGLGAVFSSGGVLIYLFSPIFWFSYSYSAWILFLPLGIIFGLFLGFRVTKKETEWF
ncbi:MAG: hypothetical protein ACFFCZ_06945 [Promethearchaeota archaeon]